MPGFQLLLGKISKLKEMIPGGVGGGAEGQPREAENHRRAIVRRVMLWLHPAPLSQLQTQHIQAKLIANPSQYGLHGETHWTLGQFLPPVKKSSQTILFHQDISMASQLLQ